jgi:hypothetical protein
LSTTTIVGPTIDYQIEETVHGQKYGLQDQHWKNAGFILGVDLQGLGDLDSKGPRVGYQKGTDIQECLCGNGLDPFLLMISATE